MSFLKKLRKEGHNYSQQGTFQGWTCVPLISASGPYLKKINDNSGTEINLKAQMQCMKISESRRK
jgi:hypothetical protein